MGLVLVTKSAAAPAHPYNGQVWIDTSGPLPLMKVYDAGGSAWLAQDETADLASTVGLLANLATTAKSNIVAAINELNAMLPNAAVESVANGVQATFTHNSGAPNSDLTFTAKEYGVAGNGISVKMTQGEILSVVSPVVGNLIDITYTAGATAAQIVALLNGTDVDNYITYSDEGDGSGAVDALVETPLATGADVTPGEIGSIRVDSDGVTAYVKIDANTWRKWTIAQL